MTLLARLKVHRIYLALACVLLLAAVAAQAQGISYRGEGGSAARSSCGSITPSLPGGTAVDDLLIAAVAAGASPTLTMSGWNQLFLQNPVSNLTSALYWRFATGGDTTTITQSGSCNAIVARISAFTGVDTATPFVTAPLGTGNWSYQNSSTVTTGAQTTTFAGAMLVSTAHSTDNDTFGTLGGYTRAYTSATSSGNDAAIALYYALQPAAGSFGSYTYTKSQGADPNHGTLFALRPRPTVISIDRADTDPTNAASVSWTVTFSTDVTGVSASNFTLVNTGLSGAVAITGVSGSGSVWTVTAGTGTGTGTLGLNMANSTGLSPALYGLPFTGQVYSVRQPIVVTYYHDTTNGVNIGVDGPTNVVSGNNVTIPPIITASLTLSNTCTGSARSNDHPTGLYTHSRWYFTSDYAVDMDIGANPAGRARLRGNATSDTVVVSLYDYDAVSGAKALIGASAPITLTGGSNTTAYAYNISSALYTVPAGHRLMLEYSFDQPSTTNNARVYCSAADSYISVAETPTPVTSALAEYRMDAASWNGTANEVVDSSGNGNHGQAFNSASTAGTTPAIAGNPGTCRYGVFDNGGAINQGYVLTPLPDLNANFTVTAWIRTTDNSIPGQRILVDDDNNSGGYGISLSDGTAGRVRFYSRGITPIILDSAYTIANNTWYFIAAVADITNQKRTIYVFNGAGALLDTTTEAAWSAGTWGTDAGPVSIGGETNASGEPPASFHFRGNLDEVRVYQQALTPAAVAAIATQTHACSVVSPVPEHYELSMPSNSIACLPSTVTVTACTDATSPCTNPLADVAGTTATLATSGGTLGSTTVSFGATGVASTTLSFAAAPDGTPVAITLSGEQIAASNPRQWCPDGTGCVVANSGSTTFNTAGFIFSAAAGGGVATIPAQVAGASSATYYLRAVKTNTTTKACEAALAGASAVNFGYECNNPTTCYGSNLMSVNAGAATTIARNNNGSVASYLPVNMSFDANGNAPFTFSYGDVGQATLWATKPAGGALLSALSGSSNAFVVRPGGFVLSNIKQTAAPQLANPAAANAAGAKFVKAGENFTMNVSATTTPASGASITPNYGRELAPEGVILTPVLVAPAAGAAGTFNGIFGAFANGVATGTAFNWSEVGIISLTASVGDADYLGAGDTTGTSSGNVGRFYPDHFDTVVTPQGSPVGFAYSGNPAVPVPGQPFTVTVTARNALAAPTVNYNYAGGAGFSKDVDLSVPVGSGQLYVDAVAGGAVPASKFLNGVGNADRLAATGKISFVFTSLPNAAQAVQIHAEDADTVTSSGANGTINIRHGRLRVFNAFGSEKAALSLPLRAEYWTGNAWVINADDNFTLIPNTSIALSVVSPATLATSATGTTLIGGQGSIVLAIPTPGATGNTGSVDLAINLGAGAADQSCLSGHPVTTGAAIPWLRSVNGNCAATYDRDPAARGSFGIYAPETRKTIHVRELF